MTSFGRRGAETAPPTMRGFRTRSDAPVQPRVTEDVETALAEKWKPSRTVAGLIGWSVIAAVGLTVYALHGSEKPATPAEQEAASKAEYARTCADGMTVGRAYGFLQRGVSLVLKSPSSAVFPSFTSIPFSRVGDCSFRFQGYVDSQNGFGAMIRSDFDVTVRLGTDYSWSVVDD